MTAIILGHVVSCHGLHGSFKVKSYVQDPDSWTTFKNLSCGQTFFGQWQWVKKTSKPNIILVHSSLAQTRQEAMTLIGQEITIPAQTLPVLEDQEWYWADLEGLDVFDVDNTYLGKILHIYNFGAGDIFEIKSEESLFDGILIAFSFAKEINIFQKKIFLSLKREAFI